MTKKNPNNLKPKRTENLFTLKVKTESSALGILKTLLVITLIAIQASILILTSIFFMNVFRWYFTFSIIMSIITCIHILSSNRYGQSKATWIFFMFISFGFGYFIYILSDEHILFAKSKKKYQKIYKSTKKLSSDIEFPTNTPADIIDTCTLLKNYGNFAAHTNTIAKYFPSGAQFYDDVLETLESAENFIFMEYFIISNGVLLQRIIDILKIKALIWRLMT